MSKFKLFSRGSNYYGQIGSLKDSFYPKFEHIPFFDSIKIQQIETHFGHTFIYGKNTENDNMKLYRMGRGLGFSVHWFDKLAETKDENQPKSSFFRNLFVKNSQDFIYEIPLPKSLGKGKIVAGFCCLYFLTEKGEIYALGNNKEGKLGIGKSGENSQNFERVQIDAEIIDLKTGIDFAVFLESENK